MGSRTEAPVFSGLRLIVYEDAGAPINQFYVAEPLIIRQSVRVINLPQTLSTAPIRSLSPSGS